jgi:hypothetical protein
MATAGDIIAYSDWDALYNTVNTQKGPLQNQGTEQNPSYILGVGYGVAQSSINCLPYPFERAISSITSTNNCEITFTGKHRLAQGELIFIENIQGDPTWAASDLQSTYWTVDTVVSDTKIRIGYNAFGFPAWGASTGVVRQYHISANQFNNLRIDVADIYKHINGTSPTNVELPVVTRGAVISYDVYDPYYTQISDLNTRKLQCRDLEVQDAGVNIDRVSNWNASLSAQITITWPDSYDIVQYFNTGSFIKFYLDDNSLNASANQAGNNINVKDNSWVAILSSVFPLYYGARSGGNMGYSSTPTATGRWTDSGYFDIAGTTNSIASVSGSSFSGSYGTAYDNNTIAVSHVRPFANGERSIQFNFVITDSHSNTYAENTTVDVRMGIEFYYSNSDTIPLRVEPTSSNYVITSPSAWSGS